MNNSNEIEVFLLLKEASLSSTAIGMGLSLMRKANLQNKGIYYQAFFQLTIGIERLMKLLIIYQYKAKHFCYPNNNELKAYGHDLYAMYKKIIGLDEDLIVKDKTNLIKVELISILSEFGKSSRYYNLNALTSTKDHEDPLVKWKNIQKIILSIHPEKQKLGRHQEMMNPFLNYMDGMSSTYFNDIDNSIIDKYSNLYRRVEEENHAQGYAVYYILELVKPLIFKLRDIEETYQFYPYLVEFYQDFIGDFTKYEIRNRKNWTFGRI